MSDGISLSYCRTTTAREGGQTVWDADLVEPFIETSTVAGRKTNKIPYKSKLKFLKPSKTRLPKLLNPKPGNSEPEALKPEIPETKPSTTATTTLPSARKPDKGIVTIMITSKNHIMIMKA